MPETHMTFYGQINHPSGLMLKGDKTPSLYTSRTHRKQMLMCVIGRQTDSTSPNPNPHPCLSLEGLTQTTNCHPHPYSSLLRLDTDYTLPPTPYSSLLRLDRLHIATHTHTPLSHGLTDYILPPHLYSTLLRLDTDYTLPPTPILISPTA